MEYSHLDFPTSDRVVRLIQTRLHGSSSVRLRGRLKHWDPDIHGELALAVVAKVEMLNRIVTRLNNDLIFLTEQLKTVPKAVENALRRFGR